MRRFLATSAGVLAIVSLLLLSPNAFAQDDGELVFDDPGDGGKKKKKGTPPPDNKPPTKTLERAKRLYDSGDYISASIEFDKVVKGDTKDSAANKQRAEFFMGKTLFKMGFYAASLAYFDRVVNEGTGHRFYNVTLKWLAALSRVLPETSGILEKIGQYDAEDLNQDVLAAVRDELYYLLGRHAYRQGRTEDFERAITLFNTVSRDSPFFIRAKFFEGVTYVRQFKGKPALDAFKEILVLAEEKPKQYSKSDLQFYQELAWLQMARIFYSTKQFDLSIKYYEFLPQDSADWLPSLFEASWAYFMKVKNSKALGNIHTLNAPYFENMYFPESVLLKSVIYYKYCLYDRARESVAEYRQTYDPLMKDLKNVLGKHEDNAKFYEYIRDILGGKGGLAAETQRLVLSVLQDRTLKKTFNWVDELQKETVMLEKSDQAWQTTRIAGEVLAELSLQKSLAEADAGKLARERIARLQKELTELSRDGLKIDIEIDERTADNIATELQGGQISGDNKAEKIEVDDEHFMWKFNGEYWKDELGFYRFRIRSKCPRKTQ